MRMQRAEILKRARRREGEGEPVAGVERLGAEMAGRHHRVGNVIPVDPRDGGAGFHGELLRREGEVVDLHLDLFGVRGRSQPEGEPKEERGGERAAPDVMDFHGCAFRHQPCSGWSTIASRSLPGLNVTLAMPSRPRSLSSGTFIGPGDGAEPGAGCGKAVERAVWKVTLPSTFCITWWMWPFSTVTEPKPLTYSSARAPSSVPQPHCG